MCEPERRMVDFLAGTFSKKSNECPPTSVEKFFLEKLVHLSQLFLVSSDSHIVTTKALETMYYKSRGLVTKNVPLSSPLSLKDQISAPLVSHSKSTTSQYSPCPRHGPFRSGEEHNRRASRRSILVSLASSRTGLHIYRTFYGWIKSCNQGHRAALLKGFWFLHDDLGLFVTLIVSICPLKSAGPHFRRDVR